MFNINPVNSPKICETQRKPANVDFGVMRKLANLVDVGKILQYEPTVAKIGLDTTENVPSKLWATMQPRAGWSNEQRTAVGTLRAVHRSVLSSYVPRIRHTLL